MEILNTQTDIRVFPRTSDYFQHSVGYLLVLSRPCKSKKCKTTKNISIFCRVKPKSGEKNSNISKNPLWTVYLKSSEKIKCAISEIQWQTKISGHSSGVMPLSLYGTYCWGHSPASTNHNYVLEWRHKYVSAGWWYLGHHTWFGVRAYLQAGPDLQGGADLNRGLALTW